MSNSEAVTDPEAVDGASVVFEVRELCDDLLKSGPWRADQAALSRLLTLAARTYLRGSTDPYSGAALTGIGLSTTEACTIAAAMLRSQTLTPFEFAIWFSASDRRVDESQPTDGEPEIQERVPRG